MRINLFVAAASHLSRRGADAAVAAGRVTINSQPARPGSQVQASDTVTLDGVRLHAPTTHTTILLHKPVGYVCSRDGQGSPTIYDLLPPSLRSLQPAGRLDKDSSGLLLMSDDGELVYRLTHPKFHKTKVYQITLDTPLAPLHHQMIHDHGVMLGDGLSRLELEKHDATHWTVRMHEGRNRQIRRTFAALGYTVAHLHRVQFGAYTLGTVTAGNHIIVK